MYTIIDIETTGGQPTNDRIIEIAIVKHDGENIVDEFSTLLNPGRSIPYFITKMTGISDEMVADAPHFYQVARQIVEFTEGSVFVAHNVRFDYSFVKKEFYDLGYNFQRRRLCTVRLSRKLIPGLPSYSLGKLCQSVGIPVFDRHRAMGDAKATAILFHRMLTENSEISIQGAIEDEIKAGHIPPALDKKHIDGLPEEAGVYYFHNAEGKVIYVGKSTNIKKRVIQHMQVDLKSNKAMEFKSSIAEITYIVTGSELVALLLESDEIKRMKPLYNSAQRRTVFAYGLFSFIDEKGYINFKVERISDESHPLTQVGSGKGAKETLYALAKGQGLCLKLCDLYKTKSACFDYHVKDCKGACLGEESPEDYNLRAMEIIKRFSFPDNDFVIIGKGRNRDEQSVVLVEKGTYRGFGYIDSSMPADIETLKGCVKFYKDNKDVQQILRGHIRRLGKDKLVLLPKEPEFAF
ncbi:MAG: exonuclease domain-containing protein [Bacteroidota bacterium]